MKTTNVVSFYELVFIEGFLKLGREVERIGTKEKLLGTFIVTPQGINATLAGSKQGLLNLISLLQNKHNLLINYPHWSRSIKIPFKRFKVRLKKKLLPLEDTFNLLEKRGKLVDPSDWNALISNNKTLVLDVRNEYETKIGYFSGSTNPLTKNFTDFTNFVETKLQDYKSENIAMYCTGGIRCEIASSYLLQKGFKKVFQLKGGILNYLKSIKQEEQLWKGECFVFDERVSVDQELDEGTFVQCFGCRRPLSEEDLESKKYVKGVSCPYCFNLTSKSDKKRFAQRQKQID